MLSASRTTRLHTDYIQDPTQTVPTRRDQSAASQVTQSAQFLRPLECLTSSHVACEPARDLTRAAPLALEVATSKPGTHSDAHRDHTNANPRRTTCREQRPVTCKHRLLTRRTLTLICTVSDATTNPRRTARTRNGHSRDYTFLTIRSYLLISFHSFLPSSIFLTTHGPAVPSTFGLRGCVGDPALCGTPFPFMDIVRGRHAHHSFLFPPVSYHVDWR